MIKLSNYNIVVQGKENTIIYNTRTSAIVRLANFKYDEIKVKERQGSLESVHGIESLIHAGIIIHSDIDEFETVKNRYYSHFYAKDRLNLTLLPAEYCNLSCPYCFIYKYGGKKMSDSVTQSVLSFIKNRINSSKTDNFNLKINWYGGEPLLAQDVIIQIMEKVSKISTNGVKLYSSITTNGVLLTAPLFRKLVSLGIRTYQITFDGGKSFHDKTRAFHDGKGSFDLIIRNLEEIYKICSELSYLFCIRINFLKSNYESVKPLIDQLHRIFGSDLRYRIYCRPVYDFETTRSCNKSVEGDVFSMHDGLIRQIQFERYISENTPCFDTNFAAYFLPRTRCAWCFEDNAYSFLIGADGHVYKCDTLLGDAKYSIGSLREDGTIAENSSKIDWLVPVFEEKGFKKCTNCKLLPICFGGCRRMHFVEKRDECYFSEEDIKESIAHYFLNNKEENENGL